MELASPFRFSALWGRSEGSGPFLETTKHAQEAEIFIQNVECFFLSNSEFFCFLLELDYF